MPISIAADEIYREAKLNPHDRENVVGLIEKHGIDVAAELITLLVQIQAQSSGTPYISR